MDFQIFFRCHQFHLHSLIGCRFFHYFSPVRVYFQIILLYLSPNGTIIEIMTIGTYIKDKRKRYGLTQAELAERSGVGVRFVKDLEAGKATVQVNKVNQVLRLFGEELFPQKMSIDNENR